MLARQPIPVAAMAVVSAISWLTLEQFVAMMILQLLSSSMRKPGTDPRCSHGGRIQHEWQNTYLSLTKSKDKTLLSTMSMCDMWPSNWLYEKHVNAPRQVYIYQAKGNYVYVYIFCNLDLKLGYMDRANFRYTYFFFAGEDCHRRYVEWKLLMCSQWSSHGMIS